MSWAVVAIGAGAAISAGGSYLSSSSKDKKGSAALKQAQGAGAFGRVPEAAEYQPVNFDQVQLDAILGNTRNRQPINNLVQVDNDKITQEALRRARRLVPGYDSMMRTYGAAGSDLLNMKVPFDDVLGIISERNELANTIGVPGAGTINATLKDLGMSRMGALQAGGGILKDMVGMAESISPVSRYETPTRWMVNPTDRINMELNQNQLIQQSEQNANNLEATGDPAAYAQFQLQLAQAGGGSAAGNAMQTGGGMLSMLGSSGALTGGGSSMYPKNTASGARYTGQYNGLPVYRPQVSYA